MTILELSTHKIIPFEVNDEKLKNLFSFFLHCAPTIKSKTAMKISEERLHTNWMCFLENNNLKPSKVYAESHSDLEKSCEINGLGFDTTISRKTKGFLCVRHGKEKDYECVLRCIRNSIAHNDVFFCNAGNRKFILFHDNNKNDKFKARILFSQSTLASLKKEITK